MKAGFFSGSDDVPVFTFGGENISAGVLYVFNGYMDFLFKLKKIKAEYIEDDFFRYNITLIDYICHDILNCFSVFDDRQKKFISNNDGYFSEIETSKNTEN